ncbi:heparinase II/III family protein [Kordiimonas aquimaris]|uniref:heparinase II/III family protein n=1 Tax=Kordiimonas aquimaris TaxID=707591 RepID=UPI0021CF151A|nr:heparinase II/III family protein [Kordiimonas aquimaris]
MNVERVVASPSDWNNPNTQKLWLYNLHYHDGLVCSETPGDEKRDLIQRWIEENPVGEGNGWEPYTLSLRIVNWIKWLCASNEPVAGMIESLAQQVSSLRGQLEYHLLGNHLFANAKALVFAGCFFEGPEAQKWLGKGLSILKLEVPEQFLADGGHFELSTTYHATLTEDLLDIINITRTYGHGIPAAWECASERALEWQRVMTRPDGLPPLFNDAAYGNSPSLDEIEAYAARLGLERKSLKSETVSVVDLPDSGYFRMNGEHYSLLGDAGKIGPDYIPGHAHCDMLNFELFAHGKPIFVDVGTSTYEVSDRRMYERSTAAHNVVQVGNREQSEMWSAFRVARRARITNREVDESSVSTTYENFDRSYQHARKFVSEQNRITLRDEIVSRNEQDGAIARFHVHPDIDVKIVGSEVTVGLCSLSFTDAVKIQLVPFNYAPEFNKLVPATCIEVHFERTLETIISI